MKCLRIVMTVLSLAFGVLMFAPDAAKADEWNKKTLITFKEPVQLPGIVLPAGTYLFKLADPWAVRDVVQVFDKSETKLYATLLAIPNYRMAPTDKTVITFDGQPQPSGAPEVVKAWFYPGDNTVKNSYIRHRGPWSWQKSATSKPPGADYDESECPDTNYPTRTIGAS